MEYATRDVQRVKPSLDPLLLDLERFWRYGLSRWAFPDRRPPVIPAVVFLAEFVEVFIVLADGLHRMPAS